MDEDSKGALSILPEGFYDILGILIPGICFSAALTALHFPYFGIPFPNDLYQSLGYLLVSYVMGHGLYAASNFAVPLVFNRFTVSPRITMLGLDEHGNSAPSKFFRVKSDSESVSLLLRHIKEKWNIPGQALDPTLYYELCRNYVHVKDSRRGTFIRKEQAYGELARSMTFGAFLWTGLIWLCQVDILDRVCYAGVAFLVILVFGWRYSHSRHIDGVFVYSNFIVLRQEELETGQAES